MHLPGLFGLGVATHHPASGAIHFQVLAASIATLILALEMSKPSQKGVSDNAHVRYRVEGTNP